MEDGIFALIALLAVSGVALTGLRILLNYRLKRLQIQGGGGPQEASRMEEGLSEIKDQMYLLRGDLAELQERMDFTERVLARGKNAEGLPKA
jgi:hypothetical protein